jgi:phosphoglycolate phosphatase-like HAD superfamily hydrolase
VIRALIWDAGGTLFDTYPAVVAACQSVLNTRGVDVEGPRLMGLFRQTTSSALRKLADTFDLDADALERDFRDAYRAMPPEKQPPFPGVLPVCQYIHETGGYNFIVTHRDWGNLRPLLDYYAMRPLFTDWITEEDPYPRKPDPASIHAMVDRYSLNLRTCLAIGDREIDVLAAHRAGVLSCFFAGREDRSEILGRLQPAASLVISDFYELLTWLQEDDNVQHQTS